MTIEAPSTRKQKAALASLATSAALTLAKLAVGLLTGSIGILSEAAHSALDVGATLVTFAAVRVSDLPADDDHPYGHGKIESVAALSETALLILTSLFIVWEAGQRLIVGGGPVEVTFWSMGLIAAAIAVDLYRAATLRRVARETRSQALEADALHFASDVWSSSAVLIGLILTRLGEPRADAIAGLVVAGFVCRAGWQLGRRTIDTLIDTAPPGTIDQITRIARRTPGVIEIRRVRSRSSGSLVHVDIDAGVSRTRPLDRVDELRGELTQRVRAAFPEAEVQVTTFPIALDRETVRERILMTAAYHGLAVHHVTVQVLGGRRSISLDLEVDRALSLGAAHGVASALERALEAEFGDGTEIETHIEPMTDGELANEDAPESLRAAIAATLAEAAREHPAVNDIHAVRVRQGEGGLCVSFHCAVDPSETVERVHTIVSRIEARTREAWPAATRIVSHTEPPDVVS
jgi:cation diffusion facilitator family transporter